MKTLAGVITIVAIAAAVMFAGCIGEKQIEGGSSLQLKLEGVLVKINAPANENEVVSFLENALDADVNYYKSDDGVRYEISKNVSLEAINDLLIQVNGSVALENGKPVFIEGVSPETTERVKRFFEGRFAALGWKNVKVYKQNGFIIIDLPGVSPSEAIDMFGDPAKFELRIKTNGTEEIKKGESLDDIRDITKHVPYGDDIKDVRSVPERGYENGQWGVSFQLSEKGAITFRDAAMRYGVVKDPLSHEVVMLLNDKVIFVAPFSPELAKDIENEPIYNLMIMTGIGDAGLKEAKELIIHLRASMLPVNVKIVRSVELPAS